MAPLPITGSGRSKNLLLVEDNAGDIRLTQEALREGNIPVNLSVATDGVEAVEFLHRTGKYKDAPRPDLILLDLNLPRKNGGEVLSEIKNDPDLKTIPVLIMTTSQAQQDVTRAYSLNANCYITKPIDLEEFMDLVHSIEDFWLDKACLPPKS